MHVHTIRARYSRRVQPQDYCPVDAEVEFAASLEEGSEDDYLSAAAELMAQARTLVHDTLRNKKETTAEPEAETAEPEPAKEKPKRKARRTKEQIEADRATEAATETTEPETVSGEANTDETPDPEPEVEDDSADSKVLHQLINKAIKKGYLDKTHVQEMMAAEGGAYKLSELEPASVIRIRTSVEALIESAKE